MQLFLLHCCADIIIILSISSMYLLQRAQYMKESALEDAKKILSATYHDSQMFQIISPETLAPSTESKQNDAIAASEEANRIEMELIRKEDSDFEITEAIFMQSLGLGSHSTSISNSNSLSRS